MGQPPVPALGITELASPLEPVDGTGSQPRAVRTNVVRILAIRAASLLLVFLGSIVVARALGPANRGAHGFMVAVSVTLATVLGGSAHIGSYLLSARGPEHVRRLTANGMLFGLVIGFIGGSLLAIAEAVWGVLPEPLITVPAWPVAAGVAIGSFVAATHALELALAAGHPVAGATLSFAPYSVAGAAYLVLLVAPGLGLPYAVWAFAAAPLLTFAVGIAAGRATGLGLARATPGLMVASLRRGLPSYPGEVGTMLHLRSDVVLLGVLASPAATGYYVVAYQTVEPILTIASAASATVLALGLRGDDRDSADNIAALFRETMLLATALAILAAIVLPIAIPLVYGASFAGADRAALVLLPGIVGMAIARIAASSLIRTERLMLGSLIAIGAMVVNVALNVALIPRLEGLGAAISSACSYLIFGIAATYAARRALRLSWHDLFPGSAELSAISRTIGSLAAAFRSPRN